MHLKVRKGLPERAKMGMKRWVKPVEDWWAAFCTAGAGVGKMILGFMEPQTDKCGWYKASLENRVKGGMVKDLQGHAQDWTFLKGDRKRATEGFESVTMNSCGKFSLITVWRVLWRGANGKAEKLYCTEWVVCGSLDGLENTALVGIEDCGRDRMSTVRRQTCQVAWTGSQKRTEKYGQVLAGNLEKGCGVAGTGAAPKV